MLGYPVKDRITLQIENERDFSLQADLRHLPKGRHSLDRLLDLEVIV